MHILLERALASETSYLKILKGLVDLESPTNNKKAADSLADHLEDLLKSHGWIVQRHPKKLVGDQLIAKQSSIGDVSTLLLAHYDTVWPLGTLKEMPFRKQGNRIFGPGTSDMKAGIASCIQAMQLTRDLDLSLKGPVTMLVTSDEESGSHHSRNLIEETARRHDRVLVVEPSPESGELKVGRKGTTVAQFEAKGKGAHAGNNPEAGASALRELAHFLFFVENLNNQLEKTSVNLTVASGGSVPNVIAESAEAHVDMRFTTLAESNRLEQALNNYKNKDPRVEVTITMDLNRPPMEQTKANTSLLREAEVLQSKLGLDLGAAVVGGGSDGNFTSALGIATLDGLGSLGVGMHARHEHIELKETLERVALLAALLTETE